MTQQTGRPRQPYRKTEPPPLRSGSLPLLPVSLTGLGIGLLVVALLLLGNSAPARSPLATPAAAYPAENADLSLGAAGAPLTIEEWADYQCPACALFTRTLEPRLIETYVNSGRVRLVFHDFAFLGQESIEAATAAECAGEEGRFWLYHGYLFANQAGENQGTFNVARLGEIATAVGLDGSRFDACFFGREARSRVLAETEQARQAGIKRTPTLRVGSQVFQGVPSWEQFSAVIEAELAAR